MEVLVEYDYAAQNSDELTIKKGDRIRNVSRKEEGWYEGELVNSGGRRGVFPDNFVKPIKSNMMSKTLSFQSSHQQQQQANGGVKSPEDKKKSFLNNTVVGGGSATNKHHTALHYPTPTTSPPPPPPPSTTNATTLNSNNHSGGGTLPSSTKQQQQQQQQQLNQQIHHSSTNGKLNAVQHHSAMSLSAATTPNKQPVATPIPTQQLAHNAFNARVLFSYIPVNEDELAIQENEIVQVIRLVEDGWYEGIYGGRQGVFPSNYVERVDNEPPSNRHHHQHHHHQQQQQQSSSMANINNASTESLNNSSLIENSISGAASVSASDHITEDKNQRKNKKVIGIGFGDIFSGKTIELKTKENFVGNAHINGGSGGVNHAANGLHKTTTDREHHQQHQQHQSQHRPLQPAAAQQTPAHESTQALPPPPSAPQQQQQQQRRIRARVLFDYAPTQQDELQLNVGEIIYILEKNLEDEGWWRGESIATGCVGVFPDNFVEEIAAPSASAPPPAVAASPGTVTNGGIMKKRTDQLHTAATANGVAKPIIVGGGAQSRQLPQTTAPFMNGGSGGLQSNSHSTTELNGPSHSSLASSLSSSSSLALTRNHASQAVLLKQQQQQQQQQQVALNYDESNFSKSQSDMSEELDDIPVASERQNKLTHIRKATRQFNKRPPSFKANGNGHGNGNGVGGAVTLTNGTKTTMTVMTTTTTLTRNDANNGGNDDDDNDDGDSEDSVAAVGGNGSARGGTVSSGAAPMSAGTQVVAQAAAGVAPVSSASVTNAAARQPAAASPLSPTRQQLGNGNGNGNGSCSSSSYVLSSESSPPPTTVPHLIAISSSSGGGGNYDNEIGHLRQELELMRKSSSQIQVDYRSVQTELADLKRSHDDQMKRMQKKLHDLVTEIDEEKKTRLALHVELERLKKTMLNYQ